MKRRCRTHHRQCPSFTKTAGAIAIFVAISTTGCAVEFEPKFTIAELLNFVLTLGLAIVIPLWLQSFIEKKTRIKGNVGKVAEQAFEMVTSIQSLLERTRDDSPMGEGTQRQEVIAKLKSCSNLLTLLGEALVALGYGKTIQIHLNETKSKLRDYKKVVTSRAMPTSHFVPTPDQISRSRIAYHMFGSSYFSLLARI